jgi:hypothetical protein
MWSGRSTGSSLGQVKPKPAPASCWVSRSGANASNCRSVVAVFRSPATSTRGLSSAATSAASAAIVWSRSVVAAGRAEARCAA